MWRKLIKMLMIHSRNQKTKKTHDSKYDEELPLRVEHWTANSNEHLDRANRTTTSTNNEKKKTRRNSENAEQTVSNREKKMTSQCDTRICVREVTMVDDDGDGGLCVCVVFVEELAQTMIYCWLPMQKKVTTTKLRRYDERIDCRRATRNIPIM